MSEIPVISFVLRAPSALFEAKQFIARVGLLIKERV